MINMYDVNKPYYDKYNLTLRFADENSDAAKEFINIMNRFDDSMIKMSTKHPQNDIYRSDQHTTNHYETSKQQYKSTFKINQYNVHTLAIGLPTAPNGSLKDVDLFAGEDAELIKDVNISNITSYIKINSLVKCVIKPVLWVSSKGWGVKWNLSIIKISSIEKKDNANVNVCLC
jgi:hypothetical protein